jgi:hypothetical protein
MSLVFSSDDLEVLASKVCDYIAEFVSTSDVYSREFAIRRPDLIGIIKSFKKEAVPTTPKRTSGFDGEFEYRSDDEIAEIIDEEESSEESDEEESDEEKESDEEDDAGATALAPTTPDVRPNLENVTNAPRKLQPLDRMAQDPANCVEFILDDEHGCAASKRVTYSHVILSALQHGTISDLQKRMTFQEIVSYINIHFAPSIYNIESLQLALAILINKKIIDRYGPYLTLL